MNFRTTLQFLDIRKSFLKILQYPEQNVYLVQAHNSAFFPGLVLHFLGTGSRVEFTSHDQLIQRHKSEPCLYCQATPAPIVEQYSTEQGRSLNQLLQTQWAVQQGSRAFQGTALVNISIVQLGICFEFCTLRNMGQLSAG